MLFEKNLKEDILNDKQLKRLYSLHGKTVSSIYCYLLVNQIQSQKPIEVIDAIEFNFSDGDKIVISSNETQEELSIIENYNYENQKQTLEAISQGRLKIYKLNTERTEMWKDIINSKVIHTSILYDKKNDKYFSIEFVFEFENKEMRVIQLHPLDGIILDYYEEV